MSRKNHLKFFLLCVLCGLVVNGFLFFCLPASAQNKITIRIPAETSVETEVVKLGDIAQIEGNFEKLERLKTVSLGYAPNIGALRELSREQIWLSISAAGFAGVEIMLESPGKILIRRTGQTVSQAQFREQIEKFLTAKFAAERISAKILKIDLPEIIQVPKGAFEIRSNFATVQNFFLPFSVSVEIRVDGKVIRRLTANIVIEAFADVLIAVRDLPANIKISEADVRLENRRITKPLTNYLRETAQLRGLTAIKPISGGAEIMSDAFVAGVVIKNGDRVRVEAQSGKLKIIISGEARASGRIGDRIAVKNLQSGSILQAVVVDEGLVIVSF